MLAHENGILKVTEKHSIYGLKVNNTVTHPVTLAGVVETDGSCDGAGYSDPFGSWKNVVVVATVKITLYEHLANVKLISNVIVLRSGTVCAFANGYCIDREGGYTYWNRVPRDNCNFDKFSILYEGMADKIVDDLLDNDNIFTVSTEDITFAFTSKGRDYVCGY